MPFRKASRIARGHNGHDKPASGKSPFDIAVALKRIRAAVQPFRPAAMFELFDMGHTTLFEQLVACIISIRSFDEVALPCALRLFSLGRTPEKIARLTSKRIAEAIRPSSFYEVKAVQIKEIAQRIVTEFNGELPPEEEVLLSFKGVGPKCAHLAMGVALGEKLISVDIHVHRVTNRWGYVKTATPEKTMQALQEILPKRYWIDINRLLVPFGKHICTGIRPKCSTCPVLDMCRQVGVTGFR